MYVALGGGGGGYLRVTSSVHEGSTDRSSVALHVSFILFYACWATATAAPVQLVSGRKEHDIYFEIYTSKYTHMKI